MLPTVKESRTRSVPPLAPEKDTVPKEPEDAVPRTSVPCSMDTPLKELAPVKVTVLEPVLNTPALPETVPVNVKELLPVRERLAPESVTGFATDSPSTAEPSIGTTGKPLVKVDGLKS